MITLGELLTKSYRLSVTSHHIYLTGIYIMGNPLNMNNLHAPTIPSGPTSSPTTNGQLGKLTFAELELKKRNVEEELKALGSVLDSVYFPPSQFDHYYFLFTIILIKC